MVTAPIATMDRTSRVVAGASPGASAAAASPGRRPRQEGGGEHEPGRHQPQAVGEVPGGQEDGRREAAHAGPEAFREDLVGGEVLAPEVAREQEHGDDRPPREVAEDELQEREIGPEREPRDADEGRGARLGRDDRGHHHAPRRAPARREVVADRRLAAREEEAQPEGARRVHDDDREVEQAHGAGRRGRRSAGLSARGSVTAPRYRSPPGGRAAGSGGPAPGRDAAAARARPPWRGEWWSASGYPRQSAAAAPMLPGPRQLPAERGKASSPMARRTRLRARRMRPRAFA